MEQSRQVDRSEKLSSQVRVFDMRFLNSCCGCCVLLFCIHSAFPTLDGSSSSILTSVGEGGGETSSESDITKSDPTSAYRDPSCFFVRPCPATQKVVWPRPSPTDLLTDRPTCQDTTLPAKTNDRPTPAGSDKAWDRRAASPADFIIGR